MQSRRRLLDSVLAVTALLILAPHPGVALALLRASATAADPTAPLVAAVALICWLLGGWLLVVALLTGASRLPGQLGTWCAALLRRAAPAALRRAVALSLGAGVAVGTAGVGPALAAPHPVAVTAGSAVAAGTPARVDDPQLDWPGLPSAAASPGSAPPSRQAAPPAAQPSAPAPQPIEPAPLRDAAPPATPTNTSVTAAGGSATQDQVVVRPGDSLWELAAARLPAGAAPQRIAQAWPAWWSANRSVIGDDPDLLQPGQRLTPPAAAADPPR